MRAGELAAGSGLPQRAAAGKRASQSRRGRAGGLLAGAAGVCATGGRGEWARWVDERGAGQGGAGSGLPQWAAAGKRASGPASRGEAGRARRAPGAPGGRGGCVCATGGRGAGGGRTG